MRPGEATSSGQAQGMPPRSEGSWLQDNVDSNDGYIRNLPLYKAVDNGELEATLSFLDDNPDALTASLTKDGDTALHIAVLAGHVRIVEELVKRMTSQDLAIQKIDRSTALIFAATGGVTEIARYLIEKNRELLCIPNENAHIPVVVAALYGHRDLVQYLYTETPIEEFSPTRNQGAMLLTTCIIDEFYDIALDLVHCYPQLALAEDPEGDTALHLLALKPSSFPSGAQLALWQQWVYNCIHVHPKNQAGDIETPYERQANRRNMVAIGVFHHLRAMLWKGLKLLVPGFTRIYELKLAHKQAQELLSIIGREISTLGDSQINMLQLDKAIFEAVRQGIVEFIIEMMRNYPAMLWFNDEKDRNIFFVAAKARQEKIFSLIYRTGAKKNGLATPWDKDSNNILHQAAFLAPSSQLDRVSGAALQMQRELQWFKEVERIVQPKFREMHNNYRQTPRALFTDQHHRLVDEGEKWTKETAQSFTFVAALIVTIMFAAAFNAPGGYDDAGHPRYLHNNSFLIFMISDAVSLFSSTTSLLMFLGILTSRYREEDFLKTLPTKLMIGLSALFFSIVTMMITFGISLFIVLQERIRWVSFPIILLASLPVTLFALLQFPLLVEIFLSTYGPGIFDKPKKSWFNFKSF
ncbi:hypothetical protein SLE2022_288040 [Rubroshorea leprosula]